MCHEAFDYFLAALKFTPDWFVRSKLFETFHGALLANDDRVIFGEDFSKVNGFTKEMDILGVDLDKINHEDDNKFYRDDPDTIIHVRFLAWCNKK